MADRFGRPTKRELRSMRLLHLAWWEPGEVDDPPPKLVKYLKLCLAGDVTAAECAAVLGTTPERVEEITTMEDS